MTLHGNIPEEGIVLFIDKEEGWTSFDVVKKLRGMLKVKKIGHAGTLDPLATGLLIVCAGKKTKSIHEYQGLRKRYAGIIEIGKTTPSFDLETDFDNQRDISHIRESQILETASFFQGEIMQEPPVYSAIKVEGKRAYKYARRGEEVNIRKKLVEIHSFKITDIKLSEIHFELDCSKGFYVRSLARDFGEKLGVGAYLKSLRRTGIGDFNVDDAYTIGEYEHQLKQAKA